MALLMCLQFAGIHIITQRQFDIFKTGSFFLYGLFILPKQNIKIFQQNKKIVEEARQVGVANYRNALFAVYGLPIGLVLFSLMMMGAFFWWIQSGGRDQSGSVTLTVLGIGLGLFIIVMFGLVFWFSRKFPFVSEPKQNESDANGETDRTTAG
jgi:flagellar basal body-associated protein FliL